MHAYFDRDIETAPREILEEVQFKRLKALIESVYRDNPFYKRKFNERGVVPADIQSARDITKLPYLNKREIADDQTEHPPFGSNLIGGLEQYVRYHQTTGTTGRPVRWLDTKESWDWRGRCAAMALTGSGVTRKDIIFFPFAFGPHVAYWGVWEGAYQIGALAIAGGGWNTLQRIKAIFENEVTVVAFTPTYALRMAEVAKESGIDILKSSVKIIINAGEPGALIPSVRRKIEEAWAATPFDYSGLTEVGAYGIHCQHQKQAIHVNESEFIIEVVHSQTGKPVAEGEVGEMVLTNLGRPCSPAIRFRTGDLVRLLKGDCPCGRTFRMLDGGVLGRTDDMIIIRGMNIYPSQVGEIVEKHLVIGEEYQMIAYSKDQSGEFKVMIEVVEGRASEEVAKTIKEELRHHFEIRIGVEPVPRGTIPRFEYKSKRFVDKR
ncbi:MAG: phenylacetate--CoA ligase family protein [Deltaproteobacteria bacterium]